MAEEMFRAPLQTGMRTLDRSKFQRLVQLKAARIFDNKNINKVMTALQRSKDALDQERLGCVFSDPDPELAKVGRKCVVLRPQPNLRTEGPSSESQEQVTQSPTITEMLNQGLISIVPYDLPLDYSYWTYHDIMSSVLPEDDQGEIPSGFTQVGHVAHLNLRDEYLKYKHMIAEILIDKNQGIRTVINKVDDVGEESEFRTFKYEVLAGPDDMNVMISEENCTFKFDYSKVYWNSRLHTEHARLVSTFNEGDVVCDLMAGIGPFAVPAGKKRVFVWANDLNPDSFLSLEDAIKRNKVGDFVRPFNDDARTFARTASAQLAESSRQAVILKRVSRKEPGVTPEVLKTFDEPKVFGHFVLNLPASALTFLPSFVGLYPPSLREKLPSDFEMPQIHVYCFSTKSDDNVAEGFKICKEISDHLSYEMKPGRIEDGDVQIYDVRDVAPKKRMFCASFKLPEEVAFREV